MYRIAYVLDSHTSGKAVQEVKKKLPSEDVKIQIDLLWQKDLDKQEPESKDGDWQVLDEGLSLKITQV